MHVPVTLQKLGSHTEPYRDKDGSTDDAMRLSPIILSCATASWLGPTGTTAIRAQASRDYELSTEFFLVPSDVAMDRNGLASVASVISVPAPNRTVSVFRMPPGKKKNQEMETDARPYPRSLLRQRPWALPLAALSAATMLLMAGFEVFVLLKVGSFTFASYLFFSYIYIYIHISRFFHFKLRTRNSEDQVARLLFENGSFPSL